MFTSFKSSEKLNPVTKLQAEEKSANFAAAIKSVIKCVACSIIVAQKCTVVCESGHVHCDQCIVPGIQYCPAWLFKDGTVMHAKATPEYAEPDEEFQGKLCEKKLGENISFTYKRILGITKIYCGHEYCLATVRGDCLKSHMETCAFATTIKCQLDSICETESVKMNQYASHLCSLHDIPITNVSVSTVYVPAEDLKRYPKNSSFVSTLFQVSEEFFGLTFVPKMKDYCMMICAIPTFRRVEKKFIFKLVLRSNGGHIRVTIGRIGTLSEASHTVNNGGDFIRLARTGFESGAYIVKSKVIFEVTIIDTENCAQANWEDWCQEWFEEEQRIASGSVFTERGKLGFKEMVNKFLKNHTLLDEEEVEKKAEDKTAQPNDKYKPKMNGKERGSKLLAQQYKTFCNISEARLELMKEEFDDDEP